MGAGDFVGSNPTSPMNDEGRADWCAKRKEESGVEVDEPANVAYANARHVVGLVVRFRAGV